MGAEGQEECGPTPSMQEYLTAIYKRGGKDGWVRTTDVAQDLGMTPASVTEAFRKLSANGYVEYIPYRGVTLLPKGLKVAEAVARRERLVYETLLKAGVSPQEAERLACLVEHYISDEAAQRLYECVSRCGGNYGQG